jgi:hypothetical protein
MRKQNHSWRYRRGGSERGAESPTRGRGITPARGRGSATTWANIVSNGNRGNHVPDRARGTISTRSSVAGRGGSVRGDRSRSSKAVPEAASSHRQQRSPILSLSPPPLPPAPLPQPQQQQQQQHQQLVPPVAALHEKVEDDDLIQFSDAGNSIGRTPTADEVTVHGAVSKSGSSSHVDAATSRSAVSRPYDFYMPPKSLEMIEYDKARFNRSPDKETGLFKVNKIARLSTKT